VFQLNGSSLISNEPISATEDRKDPIEIHSGAITKISYNSQPPPPPPLPSCIHKTFANTSGKKVYMKKAL